MYQTFSPLLDALKERGADPEAVDRAAAEAEATGRSIRAVLINDHIVTEDQLTEASADAYGIQTLDLVGYPIDPAAITKIPMALVLKHRVLGIALNEHEITVGITDPGDVLALDDVRAATGLTVRPVVVAYRLLSDGTYRLCGRNEEGNQRRRRLGEELGHRRDEDGAELRRRGGLTQPDRRCGGPR
jgi:hypothetical protein